jgi:hypothetical protein
MHTPQQFLLMLTAAASVLLTAPSDRLSAADLDLVPPQLPKEQRENLLRFLQGQEKPDRFIPRDARIIGSEPAKLEMNRDRPPGQAIKQYMVQITPHRPVPGQEKIERVDVYYYRPNPEKGKPGITVRHTVDLATGKQVGSTEVLLNHHTPLSRDELAEAVALAREKSAAVGELYKERDKSAVRWEYLQLMISRKHEGYDPGDRVVRLVFTAAAGKDPAPAAPVRVIVNLTKNAVLPDAR